MNTPNPNPSNPPPILQKPEASSSAAFVGGTPLAAITVWCIENLYLKPRGLPLLDSYAAVAFGSAGAIFFGELWLVAKRLLDRIR
jgi:hypothetical protein